MTVPIPPVATPPGGAWALPPAGGGDWRLPPLAPADEATQGAGGAASAGGFGSALGKAVASLEGTQEAAAAQARALATGETQDVASVVTAVEEASLSMQLAAQLRNKAVEAYTEIFHTQV